MNPTINIIGAYKVEVTKQLLNEAWEAKYGGIDLSWIQRKQAEKIIREELSSVVLFEVLVKDFDEKFDVGDFSQEDQVAYNEGFLSLDGQEMISRFEQPKDDQLRIAFFLHYFDPTKPIKTSYGEIEVKKIEKMPTRLAELIRYEPID